MSFKRLKENKMELAWVALFFVFGLIAGSWW